MLPTGFGSVQTKDAVKEGAAQLGLTGTTDATLDDFELMILDDDKAFNWPTISSRSSESRRRRRLRRRPQCPVRGATTEDLTELNRQVDAERMTAEDAAQQFLEDNDLDRLTAANLDVHGAGRAPDRQRPVSRGWLGTQWSCRAADSESCPLPCAAWAVTPNHVRRPRTLLVIVAAVLVPAWAGLLRSSTRLSRCASSRLSRESRRWCCWCCCTRRGLLPPARGQARCREWFCRDEVCGGGGGRGGRTPPHARRAGLAHRAGRPATSRDERHD